MKFLALAVVILLVQPLWAALRGPPRGRSDDLRASDCHRWYFLFPLDSSPAEQGEEHTRMVNELKVATGSSPKGGLTAPFMRSKAKCWKLKISEETKVLIAKSFVTQVIQGDPCGEVDVVAHGSPKA